MKCMLAGALGAAALIAASSPGLADAAAGKKIFETKACGDCHAVQGPAREKTIDDQLAKKAPELWYAGSKFQKPWLANWLADPKPIRWLKYNSLTEKNKGDHVKLSGADAVAVADFLMSLTSDKVKAGVVKARRSAKGRLIFVKKMPCSGCHQYPARGGKIKGGRSGPSLVGAGERLQPDWILAYLMNPKVFKPVKMMPVFVGILSPRDMKSVAGYVANFKSKK